MNIKGLGVAMVTPFDKNLNVDYAGLEQITEFLVAGGVDFLVVMGTTGEAATLTDYEKEKALDHVINANQGKIPVVYGIGGNNTAKVVSDLKAFKNADVSGILSVSPSYNKPTQEGIYRHFQAVGEASDLPVILYNVPGRTASNVTAETCLRIAENVEKVQAVKEASGDMKQIEEIIRNRPQNFKVFSGDDGLTGPVMKAGGEGIISVIGNALPRIFSEYVQLCLNGNFIKAQELYGMISPVIPLLFEQGNPAGVKALMALENNCTPHVRLPLVKADSDLVSRLNQALNSIRRPDVAVQ